jgi:anion-transporting  ArsA/GET3 family ATPase
VTELDQLLISRRVVCCVGSGGVGKTTVSAALGLRAALLGRRTLVLTIDPARRLANSLGLSSLGNVETRIDPERLRAAGLEPAAELWAMTLDLRRTWDDVVTRFSPSAEKRERILGNRLYRQVSTQLAGSLEYMAMEKLHELEQSGRWDLVVLDTPPTAHALDFLDAPNRLLDLIDNDAAKWLLSPALSAGRIGVNLFQFGSSFVIKTLSRFTGVELLRDLADFLASFQGMYEGFKQRAAEVKELLASPRAGFLLVTSANAQTVEEAVFFARELRGAGIQVSAAIANRVHPELGGTGLEDAPALALALARARVANEGHPHLSERLERTIAELASLAARDRAQVERLRADLASTFPLYLVPRFERDVHDVDALAHVNAAMRRVP